MSDIDGVQRRIQKLLAIAQDPRANANEAANAAAMAERLMRKFQIEEADVIQAALKQADSFGEELVSPGLDPEAGGTKGCVTWSGILSLAVAKLNDCRSVYVRRGGKVLITFRGFKADAEVARWTYIYIVNQMAQAMRREEFDGRAESEAYRRGFVSAVCRLLEDSLKQKLAEMQADSGSRALVVSKANAVSERFGVQKQKASGGARSRGGNFEKGYSRGSMLDVGRRAVSGCQDGSCPRLR